MVIFIDFTRAIENGPVEIVSFPSYRMVDLSIDFCSRLPEGYPLVN